MPIVPPQLLYDILVHVFMVDLALYIWFNRKQYFQNLLVIIIWIKVIQDLNMVGNQITKFQVCEKELQMLV